ncbi:MAG: group I intron-associated PD-(D/E)XK endonuclease, partial [Candidatus Sulfotelmatobacter sp.]
MMFMVKAAQKGFATAKPYGDSRRYDFILDVGQRLWRVQVKSSSAKQYGSYMVNLQRNANGEV